MTAPDETPTEPSETASEKPPAAEPASSAPRRYPVLPWLSLAGFVILAGAIAWVWANPNLPPPAPPPSAAALAALSGRLDALEQKLAALPPPPDLAPLEARVAALEKRPPPAPAPPDAAALAGRIGALADAEAGLAARLDRIERLALAAAAAVALEEGRPLGRLPGQPAALARYATTAPPTLASLRLSFPAAARAELAASRPSAAGKPFLQRLLLQAGDLITLRTGNRVIIGNPAEAALANARVALDAGDLQAAVAALAPLRQPLAPPMAAWEGEAQALLAARAALAKLSG
jgi:hypothetical protein